MNEWIPITTAMPESGRKVLAFYKNSLDNGRRICAKWIAAKTDEAPVDSEWHEYDEEADCFWTPEGWYECIENWDDYTSVFVNEKVTHWMPLPEPPKEQEHE